MIKSLVIYWIKVREFWVLYERVLRHFFSFPTHTRAYFARQITKRLQNIFNVVTKQKQNRNTERIMQFFRIAAYVQIDRLYGLVYYADCAFCSYI